MSDAADPVLENITELKDWMVAGCKPRQDWRIGTEHEKFGYRKADFAPLPYEGPDGIRAMLEGLMQFGWEGKYEGDTLVGLARSAEASGGSVTLEPAGQLELSGAPLENIHQTCGEIGAHMDEVHAVAEKLGQGYFGIGYTPFWNFDAAPRMPKGRYILMTDYMPKQGGRGTEMMYLTATVQVNLDFGSEADMVEKLRIALALQPLATALFANSPFINGKPSGHLSERSLVWTDTDPKRTGMLPFAFDEGFGFEQYVDYALDVPMYFVVRDGAFINTLGMNFRDFMKGELPALLGEKPTAQDWENHLTVLFPEARVKRFIEMRGTDSGTRPSLCALPAFWVGLLYDADVQSQVAAYVADWTQAERAALRMGAAQTGLATPFRGGSLLDVARDILPLAKQGLKNRGFKDAAGDDETKFLDFLEDVVGSGKSPAERLLEQYENEWGGDIRKAYETLTL